MGYGLDAIEAVVASVGDRSSGTAAADAVMSVRPQAVHRIVIGADDLPPHSDAETLLGRGAPVSPGAGAGVACTTIDAAIRCLDAGESFVLWLESTSPSDEPIMRCADAVVTRTGGVASHAAIVARQWGIPAVCGVGDTPIVDGRPVLVDGSTGEIREVAPAAARTSRPLLALPASVATLLELAERLAGGSVRVTVNGDTGPAVRLGRTMGAVGVGLCRTEHQFVGDRLALIRPLLEGTPTSRELTTFVDAQTDLFVDVLSAAAGQPVALRLLDAPGREFGVAVPDDRRGAQLDAARPWLYEAQVAALLYASEVCHASGHQPIVTLMVPMVDDSAAFDRIAARVRDTVTRSRSSMSLPLGVMIETPGAVAHAGALARGVQRVSLGTNDLTAGLLGVDRDVTAPGEFNPFVELDTGSVLPAVSQVVRAVRAAQPDAVVSVCGQHAAHVESVGRLVAAGVDELSVGPYDVPSTRLAVAQAVLQGRRAA
ncbi:MAG: putative PEP-binding protein [Actinomycetes bacterium]